MALSWVIGRRRSTRTATITATAESVRGQNAPRDPHRNRAVIMNAFTRYYRAYSDSPRTDIDTVLDAYFTDRNGSQFRGPLWIVQEIMQSHVGRFTRLNDPLPDDGVVEDTGDDDAETADDEISTQNSDIDLAGPNQRIQGRDLSQSDYAVPFYRSWTASNPGPYPFFFSQIPAATDSRLGGAWERELCCAPNANNIPGNIRFHGEASFPRSLISY